MRVLLTAVAIAGTVLAASAAGAADLPGCRDSEDPALIKKIEAVGDATVFRYYPDELVMSEFTVEYVNCRTDAALSVNVDDSSRHANDARKVIWTAVVSPVTYERSKVIEALEANGLKAKPGKLDNTICACEESILKKAQSRTKLEKNYGLKAK